MSTYPKNRAERRETMAKNTQTINRPSVAKVIELIGSSPKSWEEATANAVQAASLTVRNITGVDLKRCTAKVKNNKIVESRVDVKIAFVVELE
jgi:flavin-binding protein dodecin